MIKRFNIQQLLHASLNTTKSPWCTSYSLRAFRRYQLHEGEEYHPHLRTFQQYQLHKGECHALGKLKHDKQDEQPNKTRGVSHYGLAVYIKKYLKAKEELQKFKYFTMQKCNLQKNPLK